MRDPAEWLTDPIECVTCKALHRRAEYLFSSRPYTQQASCHACRVAMFRNVSTVEPPAVVCPACNVGRPVTAFLERPRTNDPEVTWAEYGPPTPVATCYPCRRKERDKVKKAAKLT